MPWTDIDSVRLATGLTPEELPDAQINKFIPIAQKLVRGDTGVKIEFAKLEGAINGQNRKFKVPQPPIGDADFDLSVGATDVQVWGLTEAEDESTKQSLTVSSVYALTGLVVLQTAPSNFVELRADYYNSWIMEDPDTVKYATSLIVGCLHALSEFGMSPTMYRLGSMVLEYSLGTRVIALGLPYKRFWDEYQRLMSPYRRKILETMERGPMEWEKREPYETL